MDWSGSLLFYVLLVGIIFCAVALGILLIYHYRMRHGLLQGQADFRSLFQNAPLAYQSLDGRGNLAEVNQAWLDLLDYTRAEVRGKPFEAFLSLDSQAALQQAFKDGQGVRGLHDVEVHIRRKDGAVLPVSLDCRIGFQPPGHSQSIFCILQDISLRKETERALESKTNQQNKLIETARSLTESLDLKEVLERIAQGAKDILDAYGCSLYLLEPDGHTLTPVVAIEDYMDEILAESLQVDSSLTGRCILGRAGMIFNNAYEEPSGHQIPGTPEDEDERVIVAPLIVDSQVLGAMCLNRLGSIFTEEELALTETFGAYASTALKNAQDHTALQREMRERIQAERDLLESEERYRSLFKNNLTVMLLMNPEDGCIVDANPAACAFYGYDENALTSLSLMDLTSPTATEQLRSLQEVNPDNLSQYQLKHRLASGQEREVDVFLGPVRLRGQSLIYAIIHDITDRAQREREMGTVLKIATALRGAQTRAEMLPIILGLVQSELQLSQAALFKLDQQTGEAIVELAIGKWPDLGQLRLPPGAGIVGHVIQTGHPYLTNDSHNDGHLYVREWEDISPALAAAPLIVKDETIGALAVGREEPFSDFDLHLLSAISEISASALRRAGLFEETQRRVQRLDALHTIDKAITTNFDLDATLSVLLEQITSQLEVDAADILLQENGDHSLRYAGGKGFASDIPQARSIAHGEGIPGDIVHRRRLFSVPDLRKNGHLPGRIARLARDEGFLSYVGVPLTARGQVKGVLELFDRSPLDQDQEWWNFLDNLARQTAIALDNASLFSELQASNQELILAYDRTLEGWARALELRDKETEGHSKRVTELTLRLARQLGMKPDELVHVRRGTTLHDIGKMGIPDSILLKTGSLTEEERQIMHQHPLYAYNLLSSIPFLEKALDIPYCHHEKWDGTGYPRGLKGEQIPLPARIFALVDVWDALMSDRPYRPAWPRDRALAYLRQQAGLHFDPAVVEAFLEMVNEEEKLPAPINQRLRQIL